MAKDKLLQGDNLNSYLDSLESEGMSITRQWFDVWTTAVQYVWGEQLSGIAKNPDWDYIVMNYIRPLAFQGVAKLSKNNPKIIGHAWNDEDSDWAEQWTGIIQYIWEQQLEMRMDVVHSLLVAAVYGYAIGKINWNGRVEWDEATKRWVGDIEHTSIHPASFWSDPNATRLKDARNCGTVRKVTLDWAIAQWPKFENELRAEAKDSSNYNQYEYADGLYNANSMTPVHKNQNAGSLKKLLSSFVSLILGRDSHKMAGEETKDVTEYVWIRECYFKDDYEENIKIEDHLSTEEFVATGEVYIEDGSGRVLKTESNEPAMQEDYPKKVVNEYTRPKFPRGRHIIRVGKTILNPDTETQVYKFKRWPYNILVHHILPFMWQGSNEVEASRSSQDMLNITVAHLVHHVKLHASPQRVVEAGALAKDSNGRVREIKNKAGELIVASKGRKEDIKNLDPPRMAPEAFSLVQLLKSDIEAQQFMHETAQGKRSGGDVTANEAARIDTNAHDMIAMRSVMVDKWVEGTAKCIAEFAQFYYDTERRVRIIGTDGVTQTGQLSEDMKRVEWFLEIEPGSTLPFDEERQQQSYMAAYKLLADPVVNPLLEEMLRILKIANRQKVLMKHEQTQVFMQFIQLSQQAAQLQQAAQQEEGGVDPAQVAAAQQQFIQQVMMLMQQVQGIGNSPGSA